MSCVLGAGASIDSVSGVCGVMPGGGGGGSGGGGGTCDAAASMLNIRAHNLHETVLPAHPLRRYHDLVYREALERVLAPFVS